MSVFLIVVVALLTYGSRAFALVLMPDPAARVKEVLDRVTAPLFASLATISLVDEGAVASPESLCAAVGALVATPTRSLLWVLVTGLAGYAAGVFLLG